MKEYVESVRAIYNDVENTLMEKIELTTNKQKYIFNIPITLCKPKNGFSTAVFSKNLKELTRGLGISWKYYDDPLEWADREVINAD